MNQKIIASLIVFIAAALFITPYCGWLFDCGCTWPWAGLDSDCNNFKPAALHKCPWCGNYIKGFISTTLTIGGATAIAFKLDQSGMATRLLSGAVVFLITGFITGWISAILQGYPYFII